MKNNKRKMIARGAMWLGVITLISITVIGSYVYTTIEELKLKIDQKSMALTKNQIQGSILEEGTFVLKSDLFQYLYFIDGFDKDKFYKENLSSGIFEESKRKVFINSEIELPKLMVNSCQRYLCVQNKQTFSKIPSSVWKALLGTEDFRFLDHKGVDPIAIARAIVVDIIAMKFVQGGSTLTQQLVKNLFLTNEKKLSRKLKEMVYALYIENILEKEQIITLYLNEVFWGTFQGVYLKGFHAASLAYFNKPASELDEYEATILISLLKGPQFYNPSKKISRLQTRANAVYKRLVSLKLVTENDEIFWDDKKWQDFKEDFIARNKKDFFRSYYRLSKNTQDYLDGFDRLILYNRIDEIKDQFKKITKDADIGIKILIANDSCESMDCKNTFSYYSKFERDKYKAISTEKHQVGSLLKPIVYDSFIDLGRNYDEQISTKPITLNLLSGNWTPKDYSKAKEETISLKKALQKSKNIPLIRVASEVGFEELEKNLEQKIPGMKKPLAQYPAQLLGSLEMSLEEVFITYSKFIRSKCEKILSDEEEYEKSILSHMSNASETTISKIVRGALKETQVFGKTGTSNKGLDNWYYAFDGKNHYVIWYGVESSRDKHNFRISGATTAYQILQNFLLYRGKHISEVVCKQD